MNGWKRHFKRCLGIPILTQKSQLQYAGSKLVTKPHVESIISQSNIVLTAGSDNKTTKELLTEHTAAKTTFSKEKTQ